jgi:hypothetical protein
MMEGRGMFSYSSKLGIITEVLNTLTKICVHKIPIIFSLYEEALALHEEICFMELGN